MSKRILSKVLSLALCAFTVAPAFSACGGGGTGEKVDKTKTQLTVFHYFAGFGDAWMVELKKNFEEKVKDVSFEEGKMGVQIHIRGEMRDFTSSQVSSGQFDVFFLESPKDFRNLMADQVIEPLDSIMEYANPEDNNKTIVSKMTAQQVDAYTLNNHYYGIPHYAGNYGLIYNRDLFEEKGFFLAAEPDEETGDILISASNPTKTAGPDGVAGNEDDGLPTTYDEFFALCTEINARGVDPVCWPGQYTAQHINLLLDNLVANHEGAEQMNLNYTYDGLATDLVVIENNQIQYEADGVTPKTESLQITSKNAYELARQEGKYYAMQFIHKLLSNKDYYNEQDAENGSMSHTLNQQNFLENQKLGLRPSAMLVDGTWWQMEADDVFSYMSEEDEKYSKENRKFGWLPLPQATKEEAEKIANGTKKRTFSDYLGAVSCIKAGLPEGEKEAALQLLQYAYTDKALADFTYTTSTTIGLDYLDVIDRSRLNYYTADLINFLDGADIVYQVSGNEHRAKNMARLAPAGIYGSGSVSHIHMAVWDEGISFNDYFVGHKDFFKGCAW